MNGYQITFFTQQDRQHKGTAVAEWLVRLAQALKLPGATVTAAAEGFGKSGHLRSAHFFELSDQPMEVAIIADGEGTDRLFERLRQEGIKIFFVKIPVEFGTVGEAL